MVGIQLELQPAHGYVPLVVVLLHVVNTWAGHQVGVARKKFGVDYPQMCAEKSEKNAKAFNCVQRGHQNIVENIPSFLGLFFTSAYEQTKPWLIGVRLKLNGLALFFICRLYRPQVATVAGLARILGFVVYMRGYSSGDPQKRMQGAFGHFALLVNVCLSVEAGLRILDIL